MRVQRPNPVHFDGRKGLELMNQHYLHNRPSPFISENGFLLSVMNHTRINQNLKTQIFWLKDPLVVFRQFSTVFDIFGSTVVSLRSSPFSKRLREILIELKVGNICVSWSSRWSRSCEKLNMILCRQDIRQHTSTWHGWWSGSALYQNATDKMSLFVCPNMGMLYVIGFVFASWDRKTIGRDQAHIRSKGMTLSPNTPYTHMEKFLACYMRWLICRLTSLFRRHEQWTRATL